MAALPVPASPLGPFVSKEQLLKERKRRIGYNVALNYKDSPLLIVRGEGQYLYDEHGERYLDCVNNVAHVGHSNAAVTQAVAAQQGTLNTNSRYLHPHIVEYARRLSATLPPPPVSTPARHAGVGSAGSSASAAGGEAAAQQQEQGQQPKERDWVLFWVNSGSEANDLATRLARAHTGRRGIITTEGAYHGHTVEVIHISPYKYDTDGGDGRPPYVKEATLPCVYTGRYRGGLEDEGLGEAYARDVQALIAQFQADEAQEGAMRGALAALLQQHQASSAPAPASASVSVSYPALGKFTGVLGESSARKGSEGSDPGPLRAPSPAPAPSAAGPAAPAPVPSPSAASVVSVDARSTVSASSHTSTTSNPGSAASSPTNRNRGGSGVGEGEAEATGFPSASPATAQPPPLDPALLSWALAATAPPDGLKAGLAGFICESILSCGGQVVPPAGYLGRVYAAVRAAGGVCIADEVQVGFGRVGSSFWAFQQQGVVPDILTLGKPLGNGFPVALVVTTPEIASSFANGMEYFNTFGGNPVAGAVALATLEQLQLNGLQENAAAVGAVLLEGFRRLQALFPSVIGSVRGMGLMVGLEVLKPTAGAQAEGGEVMQQGHQSGSASATVPAPSSDKHALPLLYSHGHGADRHPDPAMASAIKYAMLRDHHMLLSTDGMADNIIKLKPPMVFTADNAREVVAALEEVLGRLVGPGVAGVYT